MLDININANFKSIWPQCVISALYSRVPTEYKMSFPRPEGKNFFLFIVVDLNNKSVNHRPLG
jgi:hypothetical protein